MENREPVTSKPGDKRRKWLKIGVVGYGERIKDVLECVQKADDRCRLAAIADIRPEADLRHRPGLAREERIRHYAKAEDMLAAEAQELDGVLVGTRCSLHTEMALRVLKAGLPLYLEKPVATTMEDVARLREGRRTSTAPVVVSFPLRVTSMVQAVKEIVDSGKIGTVEHVQAYNNVPYGSVYYKHWYRDEAETGGLFLQKATHDLDYITHVLGQAPHSVCAMTSKQIFRGTKPAGLTCAECDENRSCPESTAYSTDATAAWKYCCFAEDTGNEDSGSALIRYESGMHVSYSQNFFARREAGLRGARFLGFKGTVEFDFMTGTLKVFMHHAPRVETHQFHDTKGHFGGDAALARNFIELMRGSSASVAPLEAGILSALMCLKARESARTNTFQWI